MDHLLFIMLSNGIIPMLFNIFLERYPYHALDNLQQRKFLQMQLLHPHVKSIMCSVDTIKLLSRRGFNPNELNEHGDSVLSIHPRSFRFGSTAGVFDSLIEIGAFMTWTSEASEGLIHLAMCQWQEGNSLILKRLLQVQDIRAKDNKGRNILLHGAIHGAFNKEPTIFLRRGKHF